MAWSLFGGCVAVELGQIDVRPGSFKALLEEGQDNNGLVVGARTGTMDSESADPVSRKPPVSIFIHCDGSWTRHATSDVSTSEASYSRTLNPKHTLNTREK